jgi:hypothetical protein
MMDTDFAGKNGFIWWVGSVENRVDPLGIGRCQVRIFGWHTSKKNILPTEDLPWAHPVYPLNAPDDFGTPMLNDWVLGFFMDGESAQMPIMLGVIPGLYVPPPKT